MSTRKEGTIEQQPTHNDRIYALTDAVGIFSKALQDLTNVVKKQQDSIEQLRAYVDVNLLRIGNDIKSINSSCVKENIETAKQSDLKLESAIKKASYELQNNIDALEYEHDALNTETQLSEHRLEQEQNKIKSDISRIEASQASKLLALREELLAKFNQITEVKKSLEDKLELVALNGTNSVLRCGNNERQLALIEKKLENIYALIKELQLR